VRRKLTIAVLLLTFATAALAQSGGQKGSSLRLLTGQVVTSSNAPVDKAIVYLKNTKTLAVKTFITNLDGNYRFPALSPNVDYEVYAETNGKRSDTKVLSSLDSRPNPVIHLKINQ
jgi:Carboxypeptidase regulatory-like domain